MLDAIRLGQSPDRPADEEREWSGDDAGPAPRESDQSILD